MKIRLFLVLLLFAEFAVKAQNNSLWSKINLSETAKGESVFANTYHPSQYVSFKLDEKAMRQMLSNAPSEKSISANKSSFIITVPNSNGQIERFRIVEASVMQDGLQAKHPDIRSYAGRGIDEPSSVIRCDMTSEGFHGMIISGKRNTIYINPIDKATGTYIVFDRDHLSNKKEIFDCKAEAVANTAKQLTSTLTAKNANDGKLRIYRFAVESGGEFSALLDAGGSTDAQKKALVLSALVTDLTRVDGIMEADFGVRLDYVNNEDTIIFLDGTTDPYTSSANGYSNGAWNTQSQATLTSYIGSANYDIGHLLMGYATGGNADCIGCVCTAASKGSGATGFTTDLTTDPFVVDFWIHEIGHQFGANHTFNYSNEGTGTQMEPGSGITIMGYAGTTGTYDDSAHSIPYFHGISIQQVTNYIQTGNGSACGTSMATGDAVPVANAGADYTIPASTPFSLTGSASDADASDVLTYDWEQFDNGTTYKKPVATGTSGPQFRCYNATVSTQRNFPALQYILTGANTYTWEVLPSVSRTMNFRLTVRDNHPGGGQNNSDDMIVTVSSTSGPFKVTAPNTAVTYAGGSSQTITWNVASTTASPVSCANVAILLSTDGGNTFPDTLSAGTPNNGSASVIIPNIATTQARIKIAAVGNIFFDIDDANFTITSSSQSCGVPGGETSSAITTTGATVSWSAVTGANSYDVDYKVHTATSWTNAATATTAVSVNLSSLASSTLYDWRVRTECTSGTSAYDTAQFTTTAATACNSQYDGSTHNSFATAIAIPFNTDVHGTISTATDVDYYSFVISKRGTATVNLTTLPADYDLYIYNSSQAAAGKSKNTGTTSESVSKTFAKGTFYVKVIAKKGAFDAADCYTLNVTTGTASLGTPQADKTIEPVANTFTVFPNPVHSTLNISNAKMSAGSVVRIADIYGKSVIENQAAGSTQQIDVSKLSSGIYVISIISKDGSISTSKFVKQ